MAGSHSSPRSGIAPGVRAETLSPEDFVRLAAALEGAAAGESGADA